MALPTTARPDDRGADELVVSVLVVNEESVGLTLRDALRAEGYSVELATGPSEALAKVARTPFDVLVLDLHLGQADGQSLLTRLRELLPGTVGVILTGRGSLENAIQAMRTGADDFLVKPSSLPELKASINRTLLRRAQAEEPARLVIHQQTATDAAEAARQHLDALFLQAPAIIAVVRGPMHIVELVNPLCLQAMGRRESSELLGRPLHEAAPAREGLEFFEHLDRVFATGLPHINHEMLARIHRHDSARLEEGYFDVVLQPLRNTRGEVDGIFVYVIDVTEYVRARQRAEGLDRLKEEFIATASHDLKSPLTSIRGHAQLLLRRIHAPALDLDRVAQGLAVIESQTAAMAHLLDDLLDASRIQGGRLEPRTAPCDLGECLETVLARLNPEERARVDVALPDAPLSGEWEQKQVEQVLANLVGNALKYSPGSQRVSVAVERRPREIEMAVGDHGMGIPPEELPRLFGRFQRTPQALASGLTGTGLGLYISQGIVAAHGGRIWAESPGEGQGSTFRFTLPVAPPEPSGRRAPDGRRTDGQHGN